MSADVVIVGAGAAGTFAAFQLRGRRVLVLDVGHRAGECALRGNFYDLRKGDGANCSTLFTDLIGASFESLHNVFHPYLSPKLKGPRMRFVTRGADTLAPMTGHNFDAIVSFAAGGLANAWGAGLYRATAEDLAGFPIGPEDLEPYYDAITAKIGVSGADDDLSRFFGAARGLQPPLDIDANGHAMLRRYARRREVLNRLGLYIGRPRLAVLTRDHDGRPAYRYDALEFFRPNNPAVYTPTYTLDEMVRRGEIAYQGGVLVERYTEVGGVITVTARDCASGAPLGFTCKRLILAAGALNTARLVLGSNDDYTATLPLLDNGVSYVPLLDPWHIGGALEREMFPAATLNAVYSSEDYPRPLQMTLYSVSGTLRSDYLFDFPLSLMGNLAAAKYLSPALIIVQLFYPDAPTPTNHVRLTPEGRLELRYASKPMGAVEARLLALFRRLGYLGSIRLCRYLTPGSSFHYAGALPMATAPSGRYQTDRHGRLSGTRGVYVADAANFSALPSKNHSFTMMANAMRIAEHVGRTLA